MLNTNTHKRDIGRERWREKEATMKARRKASVWFSCSSSLIRVDKEWQIISWLRVMITLKGWEQPSSKGNPFIKSILCPSFSLHSRAKVIAFGSMFYEIYSDCDLFSFWSWTTRFKSFSSALIRSKLRRMLVYNDAGWEGGRN